MADNTVINIIYYKTIKYVLVIYIGIIKIPLLTSHFYNILF